MYAGLQNWGGADRARLIFRAQREAAATVATPAMAALMMIGWLPCRVTRIRVVIAGLPHPTAPPKHAESISEIASRQGPTFFSFGQVISGSVRLVAGAGSASCPRAWGARGFPEGRCPTSGSPTDRPSRGTSPPHRKPDSSESDGSRIIGVVSIPRRSMDHASPRLDARRRRHRS